MSTESTQSKACCSLPAIVSKGYEPKGKYITVDGMKTYATGPSTAKRAILIIYDIFGFFPQTLQGADILAHSDNEHPYQVFIPDFFDGEPADISWYPPDNEEKGKLLGDFFSTKAAPPKTLPRVQKVVEELSGKGIQSWGILGFCWGGKIVNLSSLESTPFKAAVAAHPAMVAADDAPGITIPYAMLPSGDESKEDVEKWEKGLKVPHLVEWFPDQIHGFMAARSNLEDPKVKSQYERGYQTTLDFFHKYV
ncbi:dienelactone hydrolase family protein-like protein [Mytilinidion resinicola]|uniref:Dienelactone hydrolase family protein-like protein n=1 Tax=Mytilinidion resinicola TaxID=574789 RepID=A0A6A6YP18_9PEZI|nr:dienelactone hydrolase family protein-like protein [Mytilinidion resinicola]KAF2810323.1 dienelactone hydrolase family protein-like protein [Mytilinidion resinicola]